MIRSLVAMALTLGMATSAFAADNAYFEIKKVKVTDVTEQYAPQMHLFAKKANGLNADCNSSQMPLAPKFTGDRTLGSVNPLDAVELIVDQIINIGKKIFNVINAGRPVVNINLDTANALPKGLSCWSDLSGWNIPQSKVYNVQYENGFGMTVVDFTYRVTYTAGGSADGIGKYITNATFQPANVSVGWGFQLDATAVIPSVFNTGTKRDPVAGMQMNMEWKVTSAMAHEQSTETYFVSGENKLVHME
ncbi:hypothetical protein AZI87_15550 [Bdellovibrio bacteriovorus]|uniref:Uncharacterized protein n=1 Tax=Bdellovibrio bacteriovorus TaxID=959 RepID=A0A162FXF1_BDEBC|nr:hypothetical protein [Bdellovibrio bacteriovorus]KYG62699.1 hypothetical protein AZI87_15550 [Bdellovibrio bacteriovorus]